MWAFVESIIPVACYRKDAIDYFVVNQELVGGDWNMTFIFPDVGNHYSK